MYLFLIIIAIELFIVYILFSMNKKHRNNITGNDNPAMPDNIITKELLTKTLNELGWQYEHYENDIVVTYQGEKFMIHHSENTQYLTIFDSWWYEAPLDDIENFTLIRKAINECNIYSSTTMIYTINTEDKTVGIHSKSIILWIKQTPNISDYLRSEFDNLLHSHQIFFKIMEDLRRQDYNMNKK